MLFENNDYMYIADDIYKIENNGLLKRDLWIYQTYNNYFLLQKNGQDISGTNPFQAI